jgi:hypothetical protein
MSGGESNNFFRKSASRIYIEDLQEKYLYNRRIKVPGLGTLVSVLALVNYLVILVNHLWSGAMVFRASFSMKMAVAGPLEASGAKFSSSHYKLHNTLHIHSG